jgi:hypothetical protein
MYKPQMIDEDDFWSNWWNEIWQGKPKYSEKTCPSATLSTTNPTWYDSGSNRGRRGGKPATNHLSYGAATLQFRVQYSLDYSSSAYRMEDNSVQSKTLK